MSKDKKNPVTGTDDSNLAEIVLQKGGKSQEEVRRTGELDRGDDAFERTLAPEARTVNSPVHRAIWDRKVPVSLFGTLTPSDPNAAWVKVMDHSLAIIQHHVTAGTIYDAKNKVSDQVLLELAEAGYFGLLVSPQYGGSGCTIKDFMAFLTRVAAEGEATVAGLNSIHECIGAVDPLEASVNEELKAKYLPLLASGKKLSAFALTEPGAGSDLTAVKTQAVLVDDDHFEITGEKLFISNVVPGRVIGLVAKYNGKHAIFIAELPEQEDETFQLVPYGIHAVQHIYNQGIKFNKFRVPKGNLLHLPNEEKMAGSANFGLIFAYHGLNRGRVALCANAAGVMRTLLKSMVPWTQFRRTYGQNIEKRELVRWRLAEVASLIVGADALRDWDASLLDAGYRGELECIVAKIFGADALLETTIKALRTHGGRSFLKGHLIGDNIHDFLAPSIYEGENQMLAMAFFKALAKDFGERYPGAMLADAQKAGIDPRKFNPANPAHAWKTRKALTRLMVKAIGLELRLADGSGADVDPRLAHHAKFAMKEFHKLCVKLYRSMLIYQARLADEQVFMVEELSLAGQKLVTMLVTCINASASGDEATILGADLLCMNMRLELTGNCGTSLFRKGMRYLPAWLMDKFTSAKYTAEYRRTVNKLASAVLKGEFKQIATTTDTAILRSYQA